VPDAWVLIVEDQSVIAIDLKARLTSLGYVAVGTAGTGEAAIQQAALPQPNVILMDIMRKLLSQPMSLASWIYGAWCQLGPVRSATSVNAGRTRRASDCSCIG